VRITGSIVNSDLERPAQRDAAKGIDLSNMCSLLVGNQRGDGGADACRESHLVEWMSFRGLLVVREGQPYRWLGVG
jgi:hypothetical protein